MSSKQTPGKLPEGTFYLPYPIFAVGSSGNGTVLSSGGGGGKEYGVLNLVQAHGVSHDENGIKFNTLGALDTVSDLVTSLHYSEGAGVWVCSKKNGCALLQWNSDDGDITLLGEFVTDTGEYQNCARSAFQNDKLTVVTGGSDSRLRCFTVDVHCASTLVWEAEGHTSEIMDVSINATSDIVASCSKDQSLCVWKMATGELMSSLQIPNPRKLKKLDPDFLSLSCCRFLEDNVLVATASGPRGPAVVVLAQVKNEQLVLLKQKVIEKDGAICSLDVSGDENHFAVGLIHGDVRVLSRDLKEVRKWGQHEMPAKGVAFVDQETVISGAGDFSIHILPPRTSRSAVWFCIWVLMLITMVAVALFGIGLRKRGLLWEAFYDPVARPEL